MTLEEKHFCTNWLLDGQCEARRRSKLKIQRGLGHIGGMVVAKVEQEGRSSEQFKLNLKLTWMMKQLEILSLTKATGSVSASQWC